MEEQEETAAYVLTNWAEEARTNIIENEKVYADSIEQINGQLKTYGGLSRLEDDSNRFASRLRESEENLKNDLGGRSFFKKRMDIRKYWDVGLLGEFKDFEGVVGTNYGRFVGDVYVKLDKKGDVLVSRNERVNFAEGIVVPGMVGSLGVICGGMIGGFSDAVVKGLLTMEKVAIESGSNSIYTGAMVGGIGTVAFMYHAVRGRFNTFKNLFSDGADDLEKRVGVIRDVLVC